MKKGLFVISMLLAMFACTNTETVKENDKSYEVAFEEARNYYFKNNQKIPDNPKITNEDDFNKFFGMAAVMGKDGMPTNIDFTKQFVLAIVLPVTDNATEINPVKVVVKGDTLFYSYQIKTGEKQTFSIQPISIIILDKQYEKKKVILNKR